MPAEGKSGPLIISAISGIDISGLSIMAQMASTTSFRLCGAILVAIPTAIPLDPLQTMNGKAAGSTTGSVRDSS